MSSIFACSPSWMTFSCSSVEYPSFYVSVQLKFLWLKFIYIAHYIINDGILLLINLVIDIRLLITLKRDLAKKRENIIKTDSTGKGKKMDEIQRAESDANKLVIYTFILYLF